MNVIPLSTLKEDTYGSGLLVIMLLTAPINPAAIPSTIAHQCVFAMVSPFRGVNPNNHWPYALPKPSIQRLKKKV